MKIILNVLFLIIILFFKLSFASNFNQSQAVVSWNTKNLSCQMIFRNDHYQCSVGRSGVVENKKEGDGGTPIGTFQIRKIYYRPDRINPAELKTDIPIIPLSKNDGWCDDVHSSEYNKPIKLPFALSHENLWRDDHVYDIIAVLNYNDHPAIKGKGSAIFLHVAKENYSPTSGCIALEKNDLLKFISQFSKINEITVRKIHDRGRRDALMVSHDAPHRGGKVLCVSLEIVASVGLETELLCQRRRCRHATIRRIDDERRAP